LQTVLLSREAEREVKKRTEGGNTRLKKKFLDYTSRTETGGTDGGWEKPISFRPDVTRGPNFHKTRGGEEKRLWTEKKGGPFPNGGSAKRIEKAELCWDGGCGKKAVRQGGGRRGEKQNAGQNTEFEKS